jgi:predicted ATPase
VGSHTKPELHLNHLTRDECRFFIENLSGRDLTQGTITGILDRTDGVPLDVEELSRAVVESESVDGIPETLRDALTVRIDRLGEAKGVVQAAAVLGREFSSALLPEVSNLVTEPADAGLNALIHAGLVHAIRSTPSGDHQFKHALARDAAYDLLLRSLREAMHLNAASALAEAGQMRAELVAYHYERGGSFERDWNYWEKAGAAARERGENEEAASHYRRALEIAESHEGTPATCLKLTTLLAQTLHLTGERADAIALLLRQSNLPAAVADLEVVG